MISDEVVEGLIKTSMFLPEHERLIYLARGEEWSREYWYTMPEGRDKSRVQRCLAMLYGAWYMCMLVHQMN